MGKVPLLRNRSMDILSHGHPVPHPGQTVCMVQGEVVDGKGTASQKITLPLSVTAWGEGAREAQQKKGKAATFDKERRERALLRKKLWLEQQAKQPQGTNYWTTSEQKRARDKSQVNDNDIRRALKVAAVAKNYESFRGIPVSRIDTHSLREMHQQFEQLGKKIEKREWQQPRFLATSSTNAMHLPNTALHACGSPTVMVGG